MLNNLKKLEDKLLELGETLASSPSSYSELYMLLDQIDKSLSRVEQSPSVSMWNALQPLMKTLTLKKFLRHTDVDVRVAVASCISEITRITAPDAPYDDEVMKEIFQMIVGVFGGLGDMSSRSFQKRVSILETVAKVRSCVVMLDLECDDLILDMFRHFLKIISNDHSENVFSSMETIMTLVIEESEDISSDLLSCLLNTLMKDKDKEDALSISQRLAEKVMGNCANKIRSCLVEIVQSRGAPLSEYHEVVSSICQEDHKEANTSGEVLEDDSKLSERTVSDELPPASEKLEQEVGCPEKVGTSADTSPIVATTNGTVQMGNGDYMGHTSSPKQKSKRSHRDGKFKNAVTDRADCDNVESVAVMPDSRTDTKKANDRKTNSSDLLMGTVVSSKVDSHQDEQMMTGRGKGHNKESDSLQVNDAPTEEAEPAVSIDPEKKSDGFDNPTSVTSPTEPHSSRNKRGKRAGSKAAAKISYADAAAEQPISLQTDGEATPLKHDKSKETEVIDEGDVPASVMSNSDVKPSRNSGKKGRSKRKVDHESSGRKQKSNNKKQKKEDFLGKDVDEDQSLKEMASSLKASSLKTPRMDQIPLEVSAKPKSRKKHALRTLDISETPDRRKESDESLVGSMIKVWWPEDMTFYEGVVTSYDPDARKHEIFYSDGDVEVLLLKDERYELVKIDSDTDGGRRKAKGSASQTSLTKKTELSSNTLSNQPTKKTELSSNTLSNQQKSQTQSKRESSSKGASKPRGRPRSRTSYVGKVSLDSSETLKKSQGKDASNEKAKTPKSSGKIKDDPAEGTLRTSSKREEPGNKSKDGGESEGKDALNEKVKMPKSSRKARDDPAEETPKTGNKREVSGNKSKDERKSKGRDASNDKVKMPKSNRKLGDGTADETPKSGSKREESGNKSKDERKSKGRGASNDKAKTPKYGGKLKDDPADETSKTSSKREESSKKSKNETPRSNTKSKDDTPKEEEEEEEEEEEGGSSKVGVDKSKQKDSTPRTVNGIESEEMDKEKVPPSKTKDSNSTPKTGSDFRENSMSSKGKTKEGESENTDFNTMTGAKKRKRKGRK